MSRARGDSSGPTRGVLVRVKLVEVCHHLNRSLQRIERRQAGGSPWDAIHVLFELPKHFCFQPFLVFKVLSRL